MHSNMVHQIIFYGIKRQRRNHFRAQSCDFWVIFWFLLFDFELRKRSIVLNRVPAGTTLENLKCRILIENKNRNKIYKFNRYFYLINYLILYYILG
jgi:hypothetical protein